MRTSQELEEAFHEIVKIGRDWRWDEKVEAYFQGMFSVIQRTEHKECDLVGLLADVRRFVIGLYEDGKL